MKSPTPNFVLRGAQYCGMTGKKTTPAFGHPSTGGELKKTRRASTAWVIFQL
jgi:hypothetical protein